MTKQRYDDHSTEFGLWLRKQKEIDSSLGFVATNIDYVWRNYKTRDWMFIEEKRHNAKPALWQRNIFEMLHSICQSDKNFRGFNLIVFENTSPDDGKTFLNGKEITKDELLKFLRFEYGK